MASSGNPPPAGNRFTARRPTRAPCASQGVPPPCRSCRTHRARRPARPRRGPARPARRSRSARRSSGPSPSPAATSARRSGVVELTIALHRLLESPRDRIVWDTGHQAYPHKLLTGRLERFGTLRQLDGVGGFPRRVGVAARRVRRRSRRHGPLDRRGPGRGARPPPRARADRGRRRRRGADERPLARGAQRHRPAPDADAHRRQRQRDVDQPDRRGVLEVPVARSSSRAPGARARAPTTAPSSGSRSSARTSSSCRRRLRASVVRFAQPGQLFEDLGITYIGVVPGHDLHALLETLGRALALPGPTIVHVRTQKGRGFRPAEADQVGFHGAALPPMTAASTARRADRCRRRCRAADAAGAVAEAPKKHPNYTAVFAAELIELAQDRSADRRDHGGDADRAPGMSQFQAEFPDRFFDVGIAEQHAVTLRDRAGDGRACGRSSRCTRRSSSGRSTRPSTTSARTTSRS